MKHGTLSCLLLTVSVLLISSFPVMAAPVVSLSGTNLTFSTQLIGASSGAKLVELTNTGTTPLSVTSIRISSNFLQTSNCVARIAPRAHCTIAVKFHPAAIGPLSGSVTISDNARGSPQTVSLRGASTEVSISPASLNFATALNTTSAPQTVTVTNHGGAMLTITGISTSRTAFVIASKTCASTLAAGVSCSISIKFHASSSGTVGGTLNLSDNGGASPQSVVLNGTPVTVPPGMAISPAKAGVAANGTQQFNITVTDQTLLPVTWSVDNTTGGSSSSGTISSTGPTMALYTAPAAAGTHSIGAVSVSNPSVTAAAQVTISVVNPGSVSVLTYHNDVQRTGAYTAESALNPSNVGSATFGKLFSYPVDGQMYAQPLYVANLRNIAGGTHNVVFAATEHNSVYAFDADGLSPTPLWQKNFGPPAPSKDAEGINPELGITGTPVIDPNNDTLYVVTDNRRVFNLHALDIRDGTEKFGGPVRVTTTVPGTGADSVSGNITLEGGCYQRAALALVNNVVYLAFGHCNHGWILGYVADTLTLISKLNTTPDGAGGTLWMGGGGPAADDAGNIYVMTGVDFKNPASGYNDTFLKLSPNLSVLDFFTPSNEAFLRANDADLGSGAPLILPNNGSAHPNELVGGGKDGRVFVLDRDNMGGFHPGGDMVVQTIPNIGNGQFDNLFDTPAYWNGFLYYHSQAAGLVAFSYTNGLLSNKVASNSQVFGDHGATPSISANGNSSGIVWELQVDGWRRGGPAILHAYDATNVATELYNSNQAPNGRDMAGPAVKFTVPTIANGYVYVGTSNKLDVYGLLSH